MKDTYFDTHFINKEVKALEDSRRFMVEDIAKDMGDDWHTEKGESFRRKSLHYYVRMFLQATINRQWQMGATQVRSMIKLADETSGITSLDTVKMLDRPESKFETTEKIPQKFMEQMRDKAKARREAARKLGRK